MTDLELYNHYKTFPLATSKNHSLIYPKFVEITGRSACYPHPHRYLTFDEFLKVKEEFKQFI